MNELLSLNTSGVYYKSSNQSTSPSFSIMKLGGTAEHGQVVSPVSSDIEYERAEAMAAWKNYQRRMTYQRLPEAERKRQHGEFLVYNVLQDSATGGSDDYVEVHADRSAYGDNATRSYGEFDSEDVNQQLKEKVEGTRDYLVEE